MKPYQCFLAVLALCIAAPAPAQTTTVSGIVIDDRTGQSIKGAAVYAENQPIVVETDADGRFILTVPADDAAAVIGYALLRSEIEITAAPVDMPIRLCVRCRPCRR